MTIVINEEDKPLHKEQSQSEEEGRCVMETQDRKYGVKAIPCPFLIYSTKKQIPKVESVHVDETTGEKITTKKPARGIYCVGGAIIFSD